MTSSLFNGSQAEQAYVIILLLSCLCGAICSSVNIRIIYNMKMTGYIKLILAMSWYQLLYDITLFNAASDIGNDPVLVITQLIQFMGAVGSSIISNWIAFILFYVVVFEKSFDIMKNYMYIICSTVIIWLPMVIIYSIGALPDDHQDSSIYLIHLARKSLYYYVRLMSISFNFMMIACILYRNYQIRSKSTTKTPAEIAINTLCRRVMYYPILQTISRSGYTWYEFQYGFDFRVSQAEHDPERYSLLMYSAIITPTISFGYLMIFLTIEPNAYNYFKEIFCGIKLARDNKNKNNDDNNDENELNIEGVSESQSERIYNSANESFFSWDNFSSSIANIVSIPSDYDNRSESEIFAIIDQSQLNQQSTVDIELNNNIDRHELPINITTNIIHDVVDVDVKIN